MMILCVIFTGVFTLFRCEYESMAIRKTNQDGGEASKVGRCADASP
jgi:hypothetical protein